MIADCAEIEQRLPWFLAGSLAAEETEGVRAHLAGCDRCRAALAATRRAAEIFSAHPPVEALADYGLGLPVAAETRELLERHLVGCADCRAELELVRADPGPATSTTAVEATVHAIGPRPGRAPAAGWRALAVAASVAAAVSLSLWFGNGRAAAPDGGVALLELLPETARTRGGDEEATLVRGTAATLLLGIDRAETFEEVRLLARDADGRTLWRVERLAPAKGGGYLVHLPAGSLPAGAVALELRATLDGRESVIATYPIVVRP